MPPGVPDGAAESGAGRDHAAGQVSCRVPRPATPGSSPAAGLRAGERHAGEMVATGARSTSCPAEQIRFPTLERVTDEEFTLLSRASNNSPRGIWSDGAVMYVADESDDTVCSSNMPDAIDARLAEPARRRLRRVRRRPDGVRGSPRGWRDGDNRRSGGGSGPRKRLRRPAGYGPVSRGPPGGARGCPRAHGHRHLTGRPPRARLPCAHRPTGSGSTLPRRKRPRPAPECLRGDGAAGFSLVVYEGGSIEDLVACVEEAGLAALYVLDAGVWVSYILGAPEFVNRSFMGQRTLINSGLVSGGQVSNSATGHRRACSARAISTRWVPT